jgi:hypothetical protein
MHPKLKAKPHYVFWYSDLEALVKELYDFDFEILGTPYAEFSQNSYQQYEIEADDDTTILDTIGDDDIVAEWIATGVNPLREDYRGTLFPALDVKHILYRLFVEGHIPEGKYLMTVWW